MKLKYFVSLFVLFLLYFVFPSKYLFAQVINELCPSPNSEEPDWVEVFTNGVDISLYQLKDTSGNTKNLSEATCSGSICIVNWSNRLNRNGDTVKLLLLSLPDNPVDQITYGGQGNICIPGNGHSIGRLATINAPYEPTNIWERFSIPSKGQSNNIGVMLACPSPTPIIPSITPTNIPTPTNNPTNTPTPVPSPTNSPTQTPRPTTMPTKRPSPPAQDFSEENLTLQQNADFSQFRYNPGSEDINESVQVLGTTDNTEKVEKTSPFAFILFALGVLFICLSLYLFIRNRRNKSAE